jgi:D-sedoheptulose 7-phosphate isomerase
MKGWVDNTAELKACLDALAVSDVTGQVLEPDIAFPWLKEATLKMREAGNTLYLIGNGASASMASHTAADLAKNAHLKTKVFTDLSLITAIANDLSYEEVFAEPLRRHLGKGDMLVAISSSGRSPNVLRGAQEATKLGGMVVTLSAMKPDNPLRTLGTINFYVPADTYGMAETSHAAILHFWVDQMVALIG